MSAWGLVRTITTQTAEAGAPVAGDFVDLHQGGGSYGVPEHKRVELSFDAITLAGGVAASAVTLGVWRYSGTTKRIDKIGTIVIASGVTPLSPLIDFNGEKIHVRVESFTGGTTPNLSTAVYARPVA